MKNLLKSIGFIVVFGILFCGIQRVFIYNEPWTMRTFQHLYALKRNSVDVAIIGSSPIMRGWITPYAFQKYGIFSFPLATSSQFDTLVLPLLKEYRHYQNPKLWIIDITMFSDRFASFDENVLRRNYDCMRGFFNPLFMYFYTKNPRPKPVTLKDPFISYLFPFMKYHSNWSLLEYRNSVTYKIPQWGFLFDPYMLRSVSQKDQYDIFLKRSTASMNKEKVFIFEDLCRYLKNENLMSFFLLMPLPSVDQRMVNNHQKMTEIAQRYGIPVLNLCRERPNTMIDFNTDCSDHAHLNIYGAKKVTEYISQYIKKQYDIPDRRISDETDPIMKAYIQHMLDYQKINKLKISFNAPSR